MSLRVVLGVVGIASGAALAQDVRPNPSLDLRAISLGGLWSADGPGIYSTGFETVEGYTVNPIEPQLGWTASGTSNPFASVSTATTYHA